MTIFSPFDVGNLMVANYFVPDTLTDTFILVGEDFGVPITGGSFADTLPEYNEIRPADELRISGCASPVSTPTSLLSFDNKYAEGKLFMKTGYFHHPSCELKRLTCDTLTYGLDRAKDNVHHPVHVEGMFELNTTVWIGQRLQINTGSHSAMPPSISSSTLRSGRSRWCSGPISRRE
ncbi:hypothetical protein BLNAU_19530 [Blattamonas nauphoetae]|uniref:Uncharacterized protein n=1 Tax=Blattamonas nauphoetae TaxID=2049346 RepID=A0ABQ9X1U1_9EUKA|nr:hypothetical protein BLNAU_19530 [Blattamonas nauphoetae]